MTKFEEISEIAVDNYGIVTSSEATGIGVALKDMLEWVRNGRLALWKNTFVSKGRERTI